MEWIKRLCCLSLGLLSITAAKAQEEEKTEMRWRPVQVTFISPVGSNGTSSWNTGNDFSLNVLFGMNGGLRGAELSGLAGLLKGDMKGAQFAGLLNTAGGKVKGAQFAGLVNVAGGDIKGAQFAGLTNVAGGTLDGFQAAGLANVAGTGMQGVQAAGLVNVASGKAGGVQVAGLANIGTGKVTQVAGLFNYVKTLHGVQIGLFNYADTLEKGIPIGLFSVVRKGGYRAFELTASETFYGVASFKLGVHRFYNIFTTGAAYRNDMIVWGWGLGFGTLIPLGKKLDLSVEAVCYQVNTGEWFTHGPNLLNKLNLSLGWHVARNLALVFTPSWNVTVMDMTDEFGEPVEESFAPYWVYSHTWSNSMNLKMYPGLSIGIRI